MLGDSAGTVAEMSCFAPDVPWSNQMLDDMMDDMLTKDLNSAQGVDAGGLEVYAVWCYEQKRPSDAPDDPGYQTWMKEYAATAKLIKASIVLTSPTDRVFEKHEYQNFPGSRSGMQAALS